MKNRINKSALILIILTVGLILSFLYQNADKTIDLDLIFVQTQFNFHIFWLLFLLGSFIISALLGIAAVRIKKSTDSKKIKTAAPAANTKESSSDQS